MHNRTTNGDQKGPTREKKKKKPIHNKIKDKIFLKCWLISNHKTLENDTVHLTQTITSLHSTNHKTFSLNNKNKANLSKRKNNNKEGRESKISIFCN